MKRFLLALYALAIIPTSGLAGTIQYHTTKVDSDGALVPWYDPNPGIAYDHCLRLVWDFWNNMNSQNGTKYYLMHQVWKPGAGDSRGLGGDQLCMALSSWNLLYNYLGEKAILDNMVLLADTWLDNGLAPNGKWAGCPFPYNLDTTVAIYDGDMRGGKGILQPDKVGSFAFELTMLYKKTGNVKYLNHAITMANVLAATMGKGDGSNSPWPFRVNASTGAKAVNVDASYTTNYTGTLRAWDNLIKLGKGDTATYQTARASLSTWLKTYPLKTLKWGPFFEDVGGYSDTEINAGTLALYIMENPGWDPEAKAHVKAIIDWTLKELGNTEYTAYKVIAINEQTAYRVPGNSHTSRHASVELMYGEAYGDLAYQAEAIKRLNWATYMVDVDGKNRYIRDDIWLTDGYGDYVRHYLRGMAALPSLTPANQNHLLRTSSVVKSVSYGNDSLTYVKFDTNSTERLRMGLWEPKGIIGGTMKWDATTKVLEVTAISPTVILIRATVGILKPKSGLKARRASPKFSGQTLFGTPPQFLPDGKRVERALPQK